MKLQEFMENTLNKWVKIENNDLTIIQIVKSYSPTKHKNIFECTGYSFSNAEGDNLELDNFYMTSSHLSGKMTEISEQEASEYIQSALGV